MTYQEMLVQIPRLSTRERLQLLEVLSRSLREELTPPAAPSSSAAREATVDRLFGALKTEGQPPTDAELREGYTDYLSKKYE